MINVGVREKPWYGMYPAVASGNFVTVTEVTAPPGLDGTPPTKTHHNYCTTMLTYRYTLQSSPRADRPTKLVAWSELVPTHPYASENRLHLDGVSNETPTPFSPSAVSAFSHMKVGFTLMRVNTVSLQNHRGSPTRVSPTRTWQHLTSCASSRAFTVFDTPSLAGARLD